jgi:hypothetical protein
MQNLMPKVLIVAATAAMFVAPSASAITESWSLAAPWLVSYEKCLSAHPDDVKPNVCNKRLPTVRCLVLTKDGAFKATAYDPTDGAICGHGTGCYTPPKEMEFLTPCNVKNDLSTPTNDGTFIVTARPHARMLPRTVEPRRRGGRL